ncbi:MAG: hypothetical protein QMB64_03365, partial [Pseudomonadales bacterium]
LALIARMHHRSLILRDGSLIGNGAPKQAPTTDTNMDDN